MQHPYEKQQLYEKQIAATQSAQEFNADDQHEIETATTETHNLCTEFVRKAELHEINPNPIPHVHTPHEERAEFCKWASWFFTVTGIIVTILLTATAVEWPIAGVVGATAVFLMLEFGVKLGIAAAIPEKLFARRFHALYWPWLGILLAGIGVLWLGRNVGSSGLAALLLNYNTMGWCATEIALLFLGAYSFIGRRRFGWSGDAVQRVQTIEARIAELTKRIDRRNGKFLSLGGILVLLAATADAQCPLSLIDRSGSLVDQDGSEAVLVSAIAARAHEIPCVRIATFSSRALSTEAKLLDLAKGAFSTHDIFRDVADARRAVVRDKAKVKLHEFLAAAPRTPAACTSMLDVAARALLDSTPVLILSDGVHDCPPSRAPLPSGSSERISIILAPSKGDPAYQFETFLKRAAAFRRLLPQAQIFAEGQMHEAVARWIAAPSKHDLVKVSVRQ